MADESSAGVGSGEDGGDFREPDESPLADKALGRMMTISLGPIASSVALL